MKLEISAQQTSFFTQNGYIELEGILFERKELLRSLIQAFSSRTAAHSLSSKELYVKGRDLWRDEAKVKHFLTKTLFPFASYLSGNKSLRLASDQWIIEKMCWEKIGSLKELSSIQGLVIGALIGWNIQTHKVPLDLGILPLPSNDSSILFFQPHILLNWPKLQETHFSHLYLVAYCLSNAVYIQNSRDLATNGLKQCGYGFGDRLNNTFHPLIPKIG